MNQNIKIIFSTNWYFSALALLAFGIISFSTPHPVAAEASSARDGFELGRLWRAPSGGDNGVFFTVRKQGISEVWRSTRTGQRRVYVAPAGETILIAGVTNRHVYLHNSYFKAEKRLNLWRMSINGDTSTMRLIKSFAAPDNCFDLEFSRTTDDQFVAAINVSHFGYWEYGDGKICRSYDTRGMTVFRIGDNESTMTNIGNGLPHRPRQTTHVHSVGVGEIFGNNIFMFTAKHGFLNDEVPTDRATQTGLYKVPLSNARVRGVYQFPLLNSGFAYTIGRSNPNAFRTTHETELTYNTKYANYLDTVKGSSLIYSRVDAEVGSGCELWRFNGSNRGAKRLAQLNTKFADDNCAAELAIAFGNRLIFKKLNFQANAFEIWETQGSRATTKMLHSWTAPQPGLLAAVDNRTLHELGFVSLRFIGNRIWFVKRTDNNTSEIWRSSSLRSGAAVRFQRLWRSQSGIDRVRIYNASNTPLVLVAKSENDTTLYRMNQRTRKLVKLVSGPGLDSNITTIGRSAIFAFKKTATRYERSLLSGLYSLNLITGKLTTRGNIR